MDDWFSELGLVERNVYGFVVRCIDDEVHLFKEVVEKNKFIDSEVLVVAERNNFNFFSNENMFGLCVFKFYGVYYILYSEVEAILKFFK